MTNRSWRAITHHILNHPSEEFKWNDNKYDDVKISFNNSDFERALQDVDRVLKDGVSEVLISTVDSCATILCKRLSDDWPEQKIFERNEMQGFRDHLDLRWYMGLDPLRMLLTCAREINETFHNKLLRSKARNWSSSSARSDFVAYACVSNNDGDNFFARKRTSGWRSRKVAHTL